MEEQPVRELNYFSETFRIKAQNEEYACAISFIRESLDILKIHAPKILHSREEAYYATLTFPRRQLSYLLGRFSAKFAIATLLVKQIALTNILIEYGVFQYPLLVYPDPDKRSIHVSYSHSDECAIAIAYPEALPMGIDLEVVDDDKKAVIESQLTEREKELILSQNQHTRDNLQVMLWAIKESLSKILRTGLTTSFLLYEVRNFKQSEDGNWHCEFTNFPQYQSIAFTFGQFCFAMSYPKRSELIGDFKASLEKFVRDTL